MSKLMEQAQPARPASLYTVVREGTAQPSEPVPAEEKRALRYGVRLCGGGHAGSHVTLSCFATDYEDAKGKLIERAEALQHALSRWLEHATKPAAWVVADGSEVPNWNPDR